MIEYLLSGSIGLIVGLVGALVVLFVSYQSSKQKYYSNWIKSISEHNWKLLEHKLDPGLPITDVKLEVRVVCYQQLNLFLLAWLHKKIIEKDGSIEGWKNWADAIVKGAKLEKNKEFAYAYREILTHGDMYPKAFISWLEEEMQLSARNFKGRSSSD